MAWWQEAAIILGMFVLRLGVPLLITVAVGYWLKRLDAKWQAEMQAAGSGSQTKAVPEPDSETGERPCWVFKSCPEAVRKLCPACRQPELPCWLARLRSEGQLPAACSDCERYPQSLAPAD